jgi:hypothetical protein
MTKFPVLPLAPSRNILIALSSGQGIQPWLMGLTEVAYGSKGEILIASRCFLLFSQQRTSAGPLSRCEGVTRSCRAHQQPARHV